MKISIVTVCFNSVQTLSQTLHSVAAQRGADIDHVIVDGGSTDGTLAILDGWRGHPIRLLSEPDRGLYDAMNKGLRLARGDAIGFLNADDRFATPEIVSAIAARFQSGASVDCVYGDLRLVTSQRKVVRVWRSGSFRPGRISTGWVPPHPAFYVSRSLADRTGLYDLRYRIAADVDWMLRALRAGNHEPVYLPETLVDMAMGGASTAGWNAIVRANREVYTICRSNGIRSPAAFVMLKLLRKGAQVLEARLARQS